MKKDQTRKRRQNFFFFFFFFLFFFFFFSFFSSSFLSSVFVLFFLCSSLLLQQTALQVSHDPHLFVLFIISRTNTEMYPDFNLSKTISSTDDKHTVGQQDWHTSGGVIHTAADNRSCDKFIFNCRCWDNTFFPTEPHNQWGVDKAEGIAVHYCTYHLSNNNNSILIHEAKREIKVVVRPHTLKHNQNLNLNSKLILLKGKFDHMKGSNERCLFWTNVLFQYTFISFVRHCVCLFLRVLWTNSRMYPKCEYAHKGQWTKHKAKDWFYQISGKHVCKLSNGPTGGEFYRDLDELF